MKKVCSFFVLFITLQLSAQNKIRVLKLSSTVKPDIEKVTGDYYDHFDHIKGETLYETVSTIEYASKVLPLGASQSSITEIKSVHNNFSWQAIMFTSEDYKKAAEKYKQIYNELNGANYNMHENKVWKFKGRYDSPDDDRAFASSILEPDKSEKSLRKLKIEVALSYSIPEWTVKVLIYEKEADEDIMPTENKEE
ncbi:MAG: hypothetical protein M3139_05335 [Bacteroidota bacterium]|nr:hypothetical protein [Bacteroidota bacterium]